MLLKECTNIYNGSTPSTNISEFWDGEISWITPKDLSIQNARYIIRGERNITQKGYDSCSTKLLPKNTVLLTSRAPIGYLSIAKNELCTNQGFKSLVCNNNTIPLFIYYFLYTKVDYLKTISGGATFKELSKESLGNVNINLPSLSTQQHIVDTIGSVDDLIEKNEEIIEKIHKYIFDYYKLITNNVDYTCIKNLPYFNIIKSGIDKFEKEKIYIDTASVNNDKIMDTSYTISYDNRPSRANMQPIENSVWFAKLKDSPKYILVKNTSSRILNNYIFSTGFFGLKANEYTINYLYALILDDNFINQKNSISTGATMMGINNDLLRTIQVPNLNQKDAISFGQHIEPMIQSLMLLKEKNIILQNIKSALLSKYFD